MPDRNTRAPLFFSFHLLLQLTTTALLSNLRSSRPPPLPVNFCLVAEKIQNQKEKLGISSFLFSIVLEDLCLFSLFLSLATRLSSGSDYYVKNQSAALRMVSFEMNDRKKIGLGLTGFGIFFSFLGIVFFFDKGLIAMGNILFISGVSLTIGPKSTMQFFMKRQNFKGTISFGAGFFFVVIGWPVIGMILEAYGFIVLFSGFWPTLAVFVQRIPIFGWVFQQPFVRSFFDRYRGKRVPV
ncbi:hypothetical protein NC651_018820 [Populus alba x Populus x berolinensis]|nr:hypothetical protein NC651_018820 [Populus alba x Populus x berolinensis]